MSNPDALTKDYADLFEATLEYEDILVTVGQEAANEHWQATKRDFLLNRGYDSRAFGQLAVWAQQDYMSMQKDLNEGVGTL